MQRGRSIGGEHVAQEAGELGVRRKSEWGCVDPTRPQFAKRRSLLVAALRWSREHVWSNLVGQQAGYLGDSYNSICGHTLPRVNGRSLYAQSSGELACSTGFSNDPLQGSILHARIVSNA